jgi:uncharacterized membrane protein
VGVSRTSLAERFRDAMGDTPLNYLRTVRMQKAMRLLSETDSNLEQVSLEVGYQDAFSFSKVFKRTVGVAPKEFRRQDAADIGVNMMLLAAMVWLPRVVVGTTGVIIIAAHNLLDHVQVPVWNVATDPTPSVAQMLWQVLHQTGFFPLDTPATTYLYAGYPLLPWTGILFAGYGLSAIFAWEPARRSRLLALAAAAMLALFLALRLTHGYGDPDEWNTWPTARQTVMDFFDVQKYGPSLQFTLVTLSPSLLLLAWAGTRELNAVLHRALITLGRVPLFFYLLQWIFAHVAGIVVTAAQGLDISPYFMNGNQLYYYTEQHGPPQIGGPLWLVYVCWIAGVSAIYPLCRWFARVKAERKDVAILRYL